MNETFRPRSNFAWAGVSLVLLGLFALNSVFVVQDWFQIFLELIACIILAVVVYLFWIRPRLILRKTDMVVVNPLSSEVISYKDVLELETKWALTIVHPKGKTRVWVAPASGKRRWIADKTFGVYGSTVPLSQSDADGSETMSSSLNSLSGQAAYVIRERIKRLH